MAEKMKQNVKLIADGSIGQGGFDIYIVFRGSREFLMTHRQNDKLYSLLKSGIKINDLERSISKAAADISLAGRRYLKGDIHPRIKYRKNQARKLENTIRHLVNVANKYIYEMEYAV